VATAYFKVLSQHLRRFCTGTNHTCGTVHGRSGCSSRIL